MGEVPVLAGWLGEVRAGISNSPEWRRLGAEIARRVASRLEDGPRQFCDLTDAERAATMESVFCDLMKGHGSDNDDDVYEAIELDVARQLDEAMLRHLQDPSAKHGGSYMGSLERMQALCSESIVALLRSSPPEQKNALRLFLNRPLPRTLRAQLWWFMLEDKVATGAYRQVLRKSRVDAMSPIEVEITQQCEAAFSARVPALSSTQRIEIAKSILSYFHKLQTNADLPASAAAVALPKDAHSGTAALFTSHGCPEHLVLLLAPILFVLSPTFFQIHFADTELVPAVAEEQKLQEAQPNDDGAYVGGDKDDRDDDDKDDDANEAGDGANNISARNKESSRFRTTTTVTTDRVIEHLVGAFHAVVERAGAAISVSAEQSTWALSAARFVLQTDRALALHVVEVCRKDEDATTPAALVAAEDTDPASANNEDGEINDGDHRSERAANKEKEQKKQEGEEEDKGGEAEEQDAVLHQLCALFQPYLLSAWVGYLPLDSVLFVWDQALIAGFDHSIPRYTAALLQVLKRHLRACQTRGDVQRVLGTMTGSVRTSQLVEAAGTLFGDEFRAMASVASSIQVGVAQRGLLTSVYKPIADKEREETRKRIAADEADGAADDSDHGATTSNTTAGPLLTPRANQQAAEIAEALQRRLSTSRLMEMRASRQAGTTTRSPRDLMTKARVVEPAPVARVGPRDDI